LPKYGMRCTWIVLNCNKNWRMAIILLWCTQWRICWHSNTKYCHLIYMIFLNLFCHLFHNNDTIIFDFFFIFFHFISNTLICANVLKLLLENKKCIEKCL
jgi:hypothetical protein